VHGERGKKMPRLIDADEFKKENARLLHCDFPYLSEETLEELIDNAPTVNAEPVTLESAIDYLHKVGWMQEHDRIMTESAEPVRHGHWIKANDPMSSPFDTMKRCLCSECREWAAVTSYCPNCGAKWMRKKNELR
jgi:hypothetical protein